MPDNPLVTRRNKTWPLLVISAVALTFLPVCWHAFAGFDDSMGLYWNPHMGRPLLKNIGWYWTHPYMHLYTPVVFTVWNLLAVLGKADPNGPANCSLDPHVFHTASWLLHVGNALLVFVVLRRLMKNDVAAAMGALLYGLHPVQVEAVAWASGLKDLLCAFFCLICLWQYLRAVSPDKNRWNYPLALLALALALLSKPAAVMMPALLAVIDWFMLRRPSRKIAWSILPMLLLAGAAAIVGRAVQPPLQAQLIEPAWRPLVAADAVAFYLGKLVMPWNLAVAYGRNPQAAKINGDLAWTWIIPLTVGLIVFAFRKRRAWLVAAGLFFVLAPVPVLGWIRFDYQRISTVADHYVYLAMFGPALVLCGWLARKRSTPTEEAPHLHAGLWGYRCAALIVCLVLGIDSFHQLGYWRTNLEIWQHAIVIAPNCPEAHENLGFAYYDLGPKFAKEQAREFGIAVKMKPDNVRDRDLLAGALIGSGQVDRAIEQMKITMLLQERHDRPGAKLPDDRLAAYLSLGDLLLAKNRPDEAAAMFQKILRQLPNDPTARQHLELCVFRLPNEHPAKPVMLGSSAF